MRATDIQAWVLAAHGRQLTRGFQRLYPPHTGVFATVFGAADSPALYADRAYDTSNPDARRFHRRQR